MDYLPLNDLLQIAIDQKPDVLVLVSASARFVQVLSVSDQLTLLLVQIGPFIDSMHSMFKEGLVNYDGMMLSFDEIFLFKGRCDASSKLITHVG